MDARMGGRGMPGAGPSEKDAAPQAGNHMAAVIRRIEGLYAGLGAGDGSDSEDEGTRDGGGAVQADPGLKALPVSKFHREK